MDSPCSRGLSTTVEVNEMTADASAYVFRYEFDA
jgi:hypothetical protein